MINFDIKRRFQHKPKSRIGLDLGSSAIKILEIENLDGKSVLTRVGLRTLRDPSKESIVESVRSLVEETALPTKEVNISISGPSAIVRFISMPRMREDELRSAIKFEAEKHIPFAIGDCIVDYQVLKKDEKENNLNVLLVAVKKEPILNKIAIVEDAGLSASIVDVDTFAVANAFLKNFSQRDADKTAALLNIGASLTNVSIVRSGILCFSRDVAIGGADFNAAISKSLGIDSKAVEDVKITPGGSLQDIINCTKNMVNNLLDEMKLSFSYYENQSGRGIDEIYISGGTSGLAGLEAAFHEAFESKPFLWDPLQFLDTSKVSQNDVVAKNMNRFFAVAAGLAIR